MLISCCGVADKLRARVTVCWGSWTTHSYTTVTLGWNPPNEWQARRRHSYEHNTTEKL